MVFVPMKGDSRMCDPFIRAELNPASYKSNILKMLIPLQLHYSAVRPGRSR